MIDGEGTFFETIVCGSDEEWLETRRKGVGGSDVAAIMGLSKWSTPMAIWLQKTGRDASDDVSGKPYVQFGSFMEPFIGEWYAGQHPDREVRRVDAICRSIARPWAQASLDFEVRDPELGWGVLEIKTAASSRDWGDGVPDYYLTQVTHYMSVTGRPFADVCVFFRDSCEHGTYRVMRDEDDVAAVDAAVDDFWHGYVEADVMPRIAAADIPAYVSLTADADGDVVEDMDPDTVDAISEYQAAAEAEREARERRQAAQAYLIQRIGRHKGIGTDVAVVTLVRKRSSRLDAARLKEEMPDVYERYATTKVTSGGIRIKEV